MEQEMTIQEIEDQFDSEWVLVEDPCTNSDLEVLSGKVGHHSKDRDEVYRKAMDTHAKRIAFFIPAPCPRTQQ